MQPSIILNAVIVNNQLHIKFSFCWAVITHATGMSLYILKCNQDMSLRSIHVEDWSCWVFDVWFFAFLTTESTQLRYETCFAQPMPAEQLQKLKHYKDVLHRMIPYMRVPKERIPAEFNREKVIAFERQVTNIMETFQRRRWPFKGSRCESEIQKEFHVWYHASHPNIFWLPRYVDMSR